MAAQQLGIVFGQYVLGNNNKAAAAARGLPPVITVQETIRDEFNRDDVLVGAVDCDGKRHVLFVETDLPFYSLES